MGSSFGWSEEEVARILGRVEAMEPALPGVDSFKRIQSTLGMRACYPDRPDRTCACGCGKKLKGRRSRWATDLCGDAAFWAMAVHAGSSSAIRFLLLLRDRGVCANCDGGLRLPGLSGPWEADHVLSVSEGGGGLGLENFQTLCTGCHKEKTRELRRRLAAARRAERNRSQGSLGLYSDLEALL